MEELLRISPTLNRVFAAHSLRVFDEDDEMVHEFSLPPTTISLPSDKVNNVRTMAMYGMVVLKQPIVVLHRQMLMENRTVIKDYI